MNWSVIQYGVRWQTCTGPRNHALEETVHWHHLVNTTERIVHSNEATSRQFIFTTRTHIHTFNSPFSRTTQVSRYQKGKTNPDFTEATDSEWQCHQLGHMQVCSSLQTDNHTSTRPLSFLQAGCPSWRPTNSVKALNRWLPVTNIIVKKLNSLKHLVRTTVAELHN